MSLESRSYGLRTDSDTAGLGVVDGGVGLGVVDAVPGLGVEIVGEADPDDAEATSGFLWDHICNHLIYTS